MLLMKAFGLISWYSVVDLDSFMVDQADDGSYQDYIEQGGTQAQRHFLY